MRFGFLFALLLGQLGTVAQNTSFAFLSSNQEDLPKEDILYLSLTPPADTFDCTADFISQSNNCTVTFSDQSFSSGMVTNYFWDFGDGYTGGTSYISHTYAASGTYTVSLTIGTNTGCIDTVTKTVTVSNCSQPPSCDADFISQSDSCTVSFSDQSSTLGIIGYVWDFGDGNTGGASYTTHTYATAGSYDVTLTISTNTGCTDSMTKTVTVTDCAAPPSCDADFISQSDSCTVSFSDQSSTLGIIGYVWDFGDGNTGGASYTTHTYAAAGSYDVTLTITTNTGCVDSITRTVTVTDCPPPNYCDADFTTQIDSCSVTFTDQTSSSNGIVSYHWEFGDGQTGSGPISSHSYDSAGTYPVTLTITSNTGCVDSVTKSISITNCVPPPPTCDADFISQTDSCTTTFADQSSSSGLIMSYIWDFGDGQTGGASYVPHTYASAGTYSATLTISTNDGCVDSVTKTVTVTDCAPPPSCDADFISQTDSCTTTFADQSSSSGLIMSYVWDFGDGQTGGASYVPHTYANSGTYQVSLTISTNDGCVDSVTKTVTVSDCPDPAYCYADFSYFQNPDC